MKKKTTLLTIILKELLILIKDDKDLTEKINNIKQILNQYKTKEIDELKFSIVIPDYTILLGDKIEWEPEDGKTYI